MIGSVLTPWEHNISRPILYFALHKQHHEQEQPQLPCMVKNMLPEDPPIPNLATLPPDLATFHIPNVATPLTPNLATSTHRHVRRTADESVSSTCTQWSQYKPGVLVTGWTDGRVSFSEAPAGDGKGKTKLFFPSSEGGSVVDVRQVPV